MAHPVVASPDGPATKRHLAVHLLTYETGIDFLSYVFRYRLVGWPADMGFWLVPVGQLVFGYQPTLGAGYVTITSSHPAWWQAFHVWHVGSRRLRYSWFHFYKLILHLLLSCSNHLVSTMYFASFFIFSGFNMMNLKSFDHLPIACANLCHSRSYALHLNKKCRTVSVASIPKFLRHASYFLIP